MPIITNKVFWFNNSYVAPDSDLYPQALNKVIVEKVGVYNGRPFLLGEHVAQFLSSFEFLLYDKIYSSEEIKEICLEIIKINKLQYATLNLILSLNKGQQNLEISFNEKIKKNRNSVDGLSIDVSPPCNSSTLNKNIRGFLIPNEVYRQRSINRGFDDVLMLDQSKNINMSAMGNIFFVKDNMLITPPEEMSFDPVTRRAILKIATLLNLEVIETSIKIEDLFIYTEAFIVNAELGIRNISNILSYYYCNNLTQSLCSKFYELAY